MAMKIGLTEARIQVIIINYSKIIAALHDNFM